jgi:signal transduction histidine kinase
LVGLGLSGMQERVETLSGKMDIFSSIGEGTQILVSIPKSV